MSMNDEARRELRERAAQFLLDNPQYASNYDAQDLHELIEELHIFQAELEVQNEELRRAQHELIESRDRYYDLYDFAPVGYCSLSAEGSIEQVNLAGAELLGQPRGHLIKQPFTRFVHPQYRQRVMTLFGEAMRDTERHECEVRLNNHEEQHVRAVKLEALGRRQPGGGFAGIRLTMSDVSELIRQQQELARLNDTLEQRVRERSAEAEQKAEQLQAMTVELTRAEQRERHRLAADLHDYLAQLLVVASMKAQVGIKVAQHEEVRGALEEIKRLMSDAQTYTRTLVGDLSPMVLFEQGLGAAMRHLGRKMEQQGLRVDVLGDASVRLADDAAVLLYQSVRELLHNVLKHAGTDRVEVAIDREDHALCVEVRDGGVGFDCDKVVRERNPPESFGLLSIQQRIDAIGGTCVIKSKPGEGTAVRLCLPVQIRAPRPERPGDRGAGPEPQECATVSVLVVDDHEAIRVGVRELLEAYPEIEVVGEARDGIEAIERVRELRPRAVVMDINMPRMNGIEATRAITREFEWITVLGLSIRDDEDAQQAMHEAGARACFTKGESAETIYRALKEHCFAGRTG
jgi:PAS domain S-box-containing protein